MKKNNSVPAFDLSLKTVVGGGSRPESVAEGPSSRGSSNQICSEIADLTSELSFSKRSGKILFNFHPHRKQKKIFLCLDIPYPSFLNGLRLG